MSFDLDEQEIRDAVARGDADLLVDAYADLRERLYGSPHPQPEVTELEYQWGERLLGALPDNDAVTRFSATRWPSAFADQIWARIFAGRSFMRMTAGEYD